MVEKTTFVIDLQFPDFVRHNVNGWLDKLEKVAAQVGKNLVKAAAIQAAGRMLADQPGRVDNDFDELYCRIVQAVNLED